MRPLKYKELAFFCSQMATIIKSGISALEALSIMQEDANPDDIRILNNIEDDMKINGSLAHAIAKTKLFPNYCVQMISIGERTGSLDVVLEDLGRYYERENEIETSISNAITYPAIMSAIILAVIFVLLTKVMPVFETVFNQLGTELTGIARILLNIGIALEKYSSVILGIIVVILAGGLVIIKSKRLAHLKSAINNMSLFKDINHQLQSCHFAGIMAIVLHSGVSADEGFIMSEHLNTDKEFQENLNACKVKLREGMSFGLALKQSGIFKGIYARMITIGDRTGSLENAMTTIADMYEKEIKQEIDSKIQLIEPAFIIILSVIIGIILLSVMLPMLSIISSI